MSNEKIETMHDRELADSIEAQCNVEEAETVMVECQLCGSMVDEDEAVDSLGHGYVCKECFDKNRTLETTFAYHEWVNGIITNANVWHIFFTDNEIGKLLKAELEKFPHYKLQERINNYISYDDSSFAEYLIEKGEE